MNPTAFADRLLDRLNQASDFLSSHQIVTGAAVSLLAIMVLVLDFASSPYIEYAIVYAILIAAATQFTSWRLGLALTGFLPASHFMMYWLLERQIFPLSSELINVLLLFFAGVATVYLLRQARRMEELRQANLRLETLQETMVTVNDIVLNRLQVMQFMLHLAEQGKPLAPEQIELGKGALDEVAVKLRDLSHLSRYETTEVTSGVHAVRIPEVSEVTVKTDSAQAGLT